VNRVWVVVEHLRSTHGKQNAGAASNAQTSASGVVSVSAGPQAARRRVRRAVFSETVTGLG
jgi:hypothetical protein